MYYSNYFIYSNYLEKKFVKTANCDKNYNKKNLHFFRQINVIAFTVLFVLLSASNSQSFCLTIVEKYYKTLSRFLREINVFTKELTKELISRTFLTVIAFYSTFPHCVLANKSVSRKIRQITLNNRKNRENMLIKQLLVGFT